MRLWSVRFFRRWSARWRRLSVLQQFVVAASLAVGVNMAAMGYWAENRIYENAVASIAETNALYLEGFLSPHVRSLATSGVLSDEDKRRIDALLTTSGLDKRVEIIKIWRLDGSLIYSTDGSAGDAHPKEELLQAAAGRVAVDFKGHDGWSPWRKLSVEIYSPLYQPGSTTPIAVGEFYENIGYLRGTFGYYRTTMWIMTLVFTVSIIGSIYFIVAHANRTISRQRIELVEQLAHAARLATRNDRLRRVAEKARLNASAANEAYLADIGSDLHDGPVQVLTLSLLKISTLQEKVSSEARLVFGEIEQLVRRTQLELRTLSAGLVLPEIEQISLADAVRMATRRHEAITNTTVDLKMDALTDEIAAEVKICAYRIVQEALNNAYKHADGRDQSVRVQFVGNHLEICVSDGGQADPIENQSSEQPALGMLGLTNRVKALRGSLAINRSSFGTHLRARIPLSRDAS